MPKTREEYYKEQAKCLPTLGKCQAFSTEELARLPCSEIMRQNAKLGKGCGFCDLQALKVKRAAENYKEVKAWKKKMSRANRFYLHPSQAVEYQQEEDDED